MSNRLITWARNLTVGDAEAKFVLTLLADQCRTDGVCFPSHRTLSDDSEIPLRTLKRKIEHLVAAGLVVIEHRNRATGGQSSNLYRLLAPGEYLRESGDEGATTVGHGGLPPQATVAYPPRPSSGLPPQANGGLPYEPKEGTSGDSEEPPERGARAGPRAPWPGPPEIVEALRLETGDVRGLLQRAGWDEGRRAVIAHSPEAAERLRHRLGAKLLEALAVTVVDTKG